VRLSGSSRVYGVVPRSLLLRLGLPVALLAAALAAAPAAFADANKSANWSGYAVHRSGVNFTRVTASWVQPSVSCVPGQRTFSAFWVGLGGYDLGANALEQIGTEVDCTAAGAIRSTAWYELVPQPTRATHLVVRPGDILSASVAVHGRRVTLTLRDTTTGRSFDKTVSAALIDTRSAEWIAEAPSVCLDASSCQTLPLADFGSAQFTSARVQTIRGHVGSISDRSWSRTKISLFPGRGRVLATAEGQNTSGAAIPSALTRGGSDFTVRYAQVTGPTGAQTFAAQRRRVETGRLVHPGRG
jgi:hypothetical protein